MRASIFVMPFPDSPPAARVASVEASSRPFERVSFSRQFLSFGAAVLLLGMGGVGSWLNSEIERSAVNRAAAVSAIYVESILAVLLPKDAEGLTVSASLQEALDPIFVAGPLHRKVVRFKLWAPDGTIIYSSDAAQIGVRFPIDRTLGAAFTGAQQAHMKKPEGDHHADERNRWGRLLEVYVPLRDNQEDKIFAVAEFYHATDNIDREIDSAQRRSWIVLMVATAAILLLLFGLARRVDDTLLSQRDDLRGKLQQLSVAFDENERMRLQLGEAGAATTALNEKLLHRIAADLHDGPAQNLAFAAMRFDEMVNSCGGCERSAALGGRDAESIRGALQASLVELRSIAGGLGVQGIAELSLGDTVRRAVRDFERHSGVQVAAEMGELPCDVALAVKITIYRVLQESLSNSLRHAQGAVPRLRVWRVGDHVCAEIVDDGAGFDPLTVVHAGRLGLSFMQERVRLLGGEFELQSSPGCGTCIRASLPLYCEEMA